MQTISYINGDDVRRSHLPDPEEEVLPGVNWGRHDKLFTPAYWAYHAWLTRVSGSMVHYKLGNSLLEEVGACLLGGYGIKAELGVAAFVRLRDRGQLDGKTSTADFFRSLTEPFILSGKRVNYRFARQRSDYLSGALRTICDEGVPEDDLELRLWLLKLRGIGLKTASWITRNWKDSDRVAVIDVHIARAGALIGLYSNEKPQVDYLIMERVFLDFARALCVRTSILDTIIWSQMRRWGNLAKLN